MVISLLQSLFKKTQPELRQDDHSKKMWKQIIAITWPAFIELVLSTVFGMVDMIMVGRVSAAGLAAIGLTNQPFMLLNAVFAAVNVGTTTLVAWNIGAGNRKKASSVTRQVLIVNLVLGIMMSMIGICFARPVVKFMGGNEDTMELGVVYFQLIASGMLFMALTMAITATLRGAGETKLPMLYNIGANLLNVFGNYVLIFGKLGFPQMGVAGAALSTTISRAIACIVALYVIFSKKSISSMSIPLMGSYKPDFNIIKKVFSIGLPAALEQFVLQSGLMMFARTVSGLGTAEFAAHQIGMNINGLTFAPSMAFGVAATTLVGQSLGANDEVKAEKFAKTVHHMAMAVACFVGVIFLLFSHPMARIYTDDRNVAHMAGTVLKIVALAQLGMPTQQSVSGALRGAGDTMYPLYASAFGIWIFRVFVAHVFVNVFGWGLIGAWISLVLDQYTRASVVYFRFRSGKWKHVKSRSGEVKNNQLEEEFEDAAEAPGC
jgi:putative MATE family efflux protein